MENNKMRVPSLSRVPLNALQSEYKASNNEVKIGSTNKNTEKHALRRVNGKQENEGTLTRIWDFLNQRFRCNPGDGHN